MVGFYGERNQVKVLNVNGLVLALEVLCLFLAPSHLRAQTSGIQVNLDRLARDAQWTALAIPIFRDDPRKANFNIETSWIPGKNHKGFIRYKVFGTALSLDGEQEDELIVKAKSNFLERISLQCTLFLNLMDASDFLIRSIPLGIRRDVDDRMTIIKISANSSEQMDASEYEMFVGDGNKEKSGHWSMEFDCGRN